MQIRAPHPRVTRAAAAALAAAVASHLDAQQGPAVTWGAGGGQMNVPPSLADATGVATTAFGSCAVRASGQLATWGMLDGRPFAPPGGLSGCTMADEIGRAHV